MPTKQSQPPVNELETRFPGIPFAYPLAMESYKTARERFDLMEKRGQSLIVFVTTVGLVFITIATKKTAMPTISISPIIAILCYTVSLVFAFGSQMWGKITSPDPRLLWEKSLMWDEWTFQSNMIYWARENFETNLAVIAQRAKMVAGTLVFGLITLILLAIWVT